ncbi:MAG: transcription-repair coupling factor [Coprobacter sp.]|nr:transcription-repair coupling factor [Coprobacter sp.]
MVELNSLHTLFQTKARNEALKKFVKDDKCMRLHISGLQGSAAALLLAGLPEYGTTTLFIANDPEEAGYLYNDFIQIRNDNRVLFFPSGYKRALKYGQTDPAADILRTDTINRLQQADESLIVVTYPEALCEKVASNEELHRNTLRLAKGEKCDLASVADFLTGYGFERVDYVYEPGQFAVRGSIVDVYSFSSDLPYRIDTFGDEIESIRAFNIDTQLSQDPVNEIFIIPDLQAGSTSGISLLQFIDKNTLLAVKDLAWVLERMHSVATDTISQQLLLTEEGDLHAKEKLIDTDDFSRYVLDFKRIDYGVKSFRDETGATLSLNCSPQPIYHKNFDLVSESFSSLLQDGYKLYILSDSEKQTQRIANIFEDKGENIPFTPVSKTLHEGFIDNELHLCFFTDHQLFDRFHKYQLRSDKARSGKLALSLKELRQFEVGDYIVHIDHGVGKFGGLFRTELNGNMQEVIKLIYQNDDILFVSIHALHKLAKYRAKEGEPPRINKLGSGAWEKMKEKTKSKMKDIARDLIKLYAQRCNEKGFAFSHDTFMQHELEASFIYEDTPDQLKSTAEVKADMERDRPMDRLICGDVGFGKTEIAIRAAFKAACDNKQVAVLVPTTVLAFQHYKTFSERLKDFPVKVSYLSRARTPAQIKETLKGIADGSINIIIGTHRLIGKDVKFKDLGLLVIDEEQKFGVAVKEKLKQMRVNVDTLTMSATPIPRTLQFSLMGARDLSAITTPPPNRYPIQTEVHAFNEDIIREAVNFELSRGGQVFIVNNRIQQLYELERLVRKLAPGVRTIVGHGQMNPEELERAILGFADYEYDVLIATTIIESGIDMPNTNTIIINNAQNFGLSELHQLRGRVGRSNKKAFCYLLTPPLRELTVDARRRLQAIESFSELGSGIHIAMQDLDIRGAGNLLGAEQSGFIADLGYETYQKILREAVQELKEDEFSDLYAETNDDEPENFSPDCQIESDLELLFPNDYIPGASERISLYQELDNMEKESDIQAFAERLRDRFGRIPHEGEELIRVVSLRRMAKQLGMEKVVLKQGKMILHFISDEHTRYFQSPAFGKILAYLQKYPRRCQLREIKGKRSMVVGQVDTVKCGMEILQEILNLDAA